MHKKTGTGNARGEVMPKRIMIIDGKEADALFHDFVMAGVVEDYAYRLTAYRAAIRAGVDEAIARELYLKPDDTGYDQPLG